MRAGECRCRRREARVSVRERGPGGTGPLPDHAGSSGRSAAASSGARSGRSRSQDGWRSIPLPGTRAVAHLADQPGHHPARAGDGGRRVEGAHVGRRGLQQRGQLGAFGLAPAGAHPAHVAQPPPPAVRPGPRPAARSAGPFPGSQPPTSTSSLRMLRILIQARERTPARTPSPAACTPDPPGRARPWPAAPRRRAPRARPGWTRTARRARGPAAPRGGGRTARGAVTGRPGASGRRGSGAPVPSPPGGPRGRGGARPIRDWSSWKLARPSTSRARISPSSTADRDPSAVASGRSSGYAPVMSWPDRARSTMPPSPARYTTARCPSCLVSYAQRASADGGGSHRAWRAWAGSAAGSRVRCGRGRPAPRVRPRCFARTERPGRARAGPGRNRSGLLRSSPLN